MPEYLAPGVYVEEIEIGSKPIEGVGTSTVGFLGVSERGPVAPTLVTGLEQYRRLYGDTVAESYLPDAVEGFFGNGGKRCVVARIVGQNAKTAAPKTAGAAAAGPPAAPAAAAGPPAAPPAAGGTAMALKAVSPGSWGNRVGYRVGMASLQDDTNPILKKLFRVTVFLWKEMPPDAPDKVVDPTDRKEVRNPSRRDPIQTEDYDNLSADPASSDHYLKRVHPVSHLIVLEGGDGSRPQDTTKIMMLQGGADGDKPLLKDYLGQDDPAAGLAGLSTVDEVAILCAPNENDVPGLADKLVAECELLKDRFVILQAKQNAGDVMNLRPPMDSKYAGFYYPWLKVVDGSGLEKPVPPGGHVAGIYARTDVERGVHKAPANEAVRGIVGLQFQITKGDQEVLNPRGVNCIRTFPGRGTRVWGARTISSDPLWKYVNVRRLMIFLEESIDEGTQWVVFEPNDQRLWARVRQTISDFLTRVWRDGALMGTTPEQAFFVKCDETTMLLNDIENGRLICLIGVAPVRPAEFVIFRIAQWRSGSAITE